MSAPLASSFELISCRHRARCAGRDIGSIGVASAWVAVERARAQLSPSDELRTLYLPTSEQGTTTSGRIAPFRKPSRNVRYLRISFKCGAIRVSMPLSGGSGSRLGLPLAARGGGRYAPIAASRPPDGLKRARRLRFWAVSAGRNSSLAPFGPLRRRRASRRIRLRWVNSISSFFGRRQAASYWGVAARARATSQASSCRSRGILRATAFGQHCALSSQTSQSNLLAR